MTRWVTGVSCEFPEIKQGAPGSREEWTWMSKVPDGAQSKKNHRWTKIADPNNLCGLEGLTLDLNCCISKPKLSAVIWRLKAGRKTRSLFKLHAKTGRFWIWKPKFHTGEFVIVWSTGVHVILDSLAGNTSEPKVRLWLSESRQVGRGYGGWGAASLWGIARKGEKLGAHSKWGEGTSDQS